MKIQNKEEIEGKNCISIQINEAISKCSKNMEIKILNKKRKNQNWYFWNWSFNESLANFNKYEDILEQKNSRYIHIKIDSNPSNLKFSKNISNDSFTFDDLDNTFISFYSIDNILYLNYSNEDFSIKLYN